MNPHEYAWNLSRFLKAAEIATAARPRTPRFTAEQENDLIRGIASGSILLAYLLSGAENETGTSPGASGAVNPSGG